MVEKLERSAEIVKENENWYRLQLILPLSDLKDLSDALKKYGTMLRLTKAGPVTKLLADSLSKIVK